MAMQPVFVADALLVAGVATGAAYFARDLMRGRAEAGVGGAEEAEMEGEAAGMVKGVLGLTVMGAGAVVDSGVVGSAGAMGAGEGMGGEVSSVPVAVAVPAVALPVVDEFEMDLEAECRGAGRVSARLEEELKWAMGEVLDCGASGVAVYDSEGVLLWRDGRLVDDAEGGGVEGGDVVGRVAAGGVAQVFNCAPGTAEVPACFSGEVQNCAVLPVGESKPFAALVVASERQGFYGPIQDRVCTAVCGRLATFLFVEQFKGSA